MTSRSPAIPRFIVTLAVLSLLFSMPTFAVTVYVDDNACPNNGAGTQEDPYCSIGGAVGHFGNNVEVIVAPGTYNQTVEMPHFPVTDAVIRSSDGPAVTIIDGTGQDRPCLNCQGGEVQGDAENYVIQGFTITNGSQTNGGGMENNSCSPTIIDCWFVDNTATGTSSNGDGGAVFNWNQSQPTFISCMFLRNSAVGNGGAFHNIDGSAPLMINCLFVGNVAAERGGALYNLTSVAQIAGCTFVHNVAGVEGGAVFTDFIGAESVPVDNSILWDNAPDQLANGVFADYTVNSSDIQGGWAGAGANNLNTDPMFVTDPSPGGDGMWDGVDDDFGDLHLQAASLCIDAGDKDAPNVTATDLDGNSRVQNCDVDMGAYESPPAIPATLLDSDCDGDIDHPDFAIFASCYNKAGNPPRTLGCQPWMADMFDVDNDDDVDGVDFAVFAACFNKAGRPPRPPCGP